ncbi:MAG: hypothetical protein KDD78_20520, partial [Caldilineaceae bacterium]|nr:hypothetical protein [Caldilineaceae bacterium]
MGRSRELSPFGELWALRNGKTHSTLIDKFCLEAVPETFALIRGVGSIGHGWTSCCFIFPRMTRKSHHER